jgi:hypothetical protein
VTGKVDRSAPERSQAMRDPTRVIACDGNRYYFRRHLAHEASRDVVARNIERGWLVFEKAEDDVEVYLLTEQAPHRAKQLSATEASVKELMAELLQAAVDFDVPAWYDGVRELATLWKTAGRTDTDFQQALRAITDTAGELTNQPTLGQALRYAVGQESAKRRGTVIMLPKRVQ